jgi:hypothetical protein
VDTADVNPVVAVFLGWLILYEPLSLRTLVAAAIIVGAVALITRGSGHAKNEAGEPERRDRDSALGELDARGAMREKRVARTPKSAA